MDPERGAGTNGSIPEEKLAQLVQLGEYEKAALYLMRAGDERRAAQVLWKGGLFKRAAECLLREGLYPQAGEAYLKAGEPLLAAKAFTQARDSARAAAAYESAGKLPEAARMYLLAHEFIRAGELYDRLGDPMRSALAFEQAVGQGEAATPKSPEEMARMAQILERVKQFEKAAQIYMEMQQVNEALLVYLKAGDVPAAARLYASCQGNVGWEVLEAARRESADRLRQVAEMFYYAKDYAQAGEAFLMINDCAKAARSFEAGGDYGQAADCYARAGVRDAAARMYERGGHHEQAASLWLEVGDKASAAREFERAGLLFEAGELHQELGQVDRAIELFQKVPDTHARFLGASDQVARILQQKGHLDLAVDRYQMVLRKAGLTEETLPLQYHLALILMERGSWREAHDLLRALAGAQIGYRDVVALLAQCEEKLRAGGKPETLPPPSPAATEPPAVAASVPPEGPSGVPTVARVRGMEALQDAFLLQDLTLADLREILALGRTLDAPKGATIIGAGSRGQALYILLEGLVKVVSGTGETEEILGVLVPGEHFGEMSILDDAPTSANVVAAEESTLFCLDRKAIEGILGSNERLALKLYRAFVQTLCQRLRKVNEGLTAAK